MHIRSTLFFCVFFLLLAANATASDQLLLQVEVMPGFALQLPDTVSLAAVAPGQMVQGNTEVQVRSNTSWYLQVSGAQWSESGSGAEALLESLLHVKDNDGSWIEPNLLMPQTVASGDATGDQWQETEVEFRFTSSYADAPGAYQVQLEFTIAAEL